MNRSFHPVNRRSSWMALGAMALLTMAWMPSRSQPETAVLTPLKIAEKLDALVQPRFQEASGLFGLDRIPPAISGHDKVRRAESDPNAGIQADLKAIADSRRDYVMGFLHIAHKPGMPATDPAGDRPTAANSPGAKKIRAPFKPYLKLMFVFDTLHHAPQAAYRPRNVEGLMDQKVMQIQSRLESVALKAAPQVASGKKLNLADERWQIYLRPVMATQASCIGCHKEAKIGDTLGVMVYAVSKTTAAPKTAFVRE